MLDERDKRLLALLQTDADRSVTDLAEQVSLSPSACSRRIQRLRDDGYIARRVAILDRKRMEVPTTVFVLVQTGHHAAGWLDLFRKAVGEIVEIVEAHRLTGNYDYLLKLVLPNVEYYDEVYKQLTAKIDLFDVAAYISMDTLKFGTAVPTEFAE